MCAWCSTALSHPDYRFCDSACQRAYWYYIELDADDEISDAEILALLRELNQ